MYCKKLFKTYIPSGYASKEITVKCGTPSYDGGINMCIECEEKLNKQFPQGWRETPGDICKHGNYVGDQYGPDYICGQCEDGI